MGALSTDSDTEEKVTFISDWVFESWGDDVYYYKSSKLIWVFLLDEDVGVCYNSTDSMCDILKYYWMFIMTLNIFITLPLSHTAAVYDWGSGWYEKIDTVMGWLE